MAPSIPQPGPRAGSRIVRPRWLAALALGTWLVVSGGPVGAAAPPADAATRALALVTEGVDARRQGRLVEACGRFREAVALTPTWSIARLELGRCLRLLGDPEGDAASHLAVAAELDPDRPVVPIERAQLAADAGDAEGARAHWETAARLAPADVRAFAGLALHPPPGEAPAVTLARLRQLAARSPGHLAVWRRLAEVAEAAGMLDEAETALRAVLERSTNRPVAAAALGRFGVRHGRQAAIDTAARALAPRPAAP